MELVAFLSFMVTIEDDCPVLYVYEIHLKQEVRGIGLGSHLLSVIEHFAKDAGLRKTMLTVFTTNESAERFYRKLGYDTDEFSPQPRKLRRGGLKRPDYIIMSKAAHR